MTEPQLKRCRLSRISRLTDVVSENPLRTERVEGFHGGLPVPGDTYLMLSESLTPGMDARLVRTSVIKSVVMIDANHYRFETQNSLYDLEIFDS